MPKDFTFRGVKFRCSKKETAFFGVLFSSRKLQKKIPGLTRCRIAKTENGFTARLTMTIRVRDPLLESSFNIYGQGRDALPQKALRKALDDARVGLDEVALEIRKVKRTLR